MNKVVKKLLLGLLGVVLVAIPIAGYTIHGFTQPKIYTKTYYAALVDKINYLESLKEKKKIVLIGGSNVAFGFDSETLQEFYPEYEVVNFGLYAALGTKIMLDYAKPYIGKDDLVFVIPEINDQSMSLYFNGENTLCALEEHMDWIKRLPQDNQKTCFYSLIDFVANRDRIGKLIEPEGVYARKNFNEHYDIEYTELDEQGYPYRAHNRMALHYDPSMPVSYDMELNKDFINYLNAYTKDIKGVGANIYYGFSAVVDKAVVYNESLTKSLNEFRNKLDDALDMDLIGRPQTYIIDAHYFYDTNFHLNDAGSILRSDYFADDILEYCKEFEDDPRIIEYIEPEKPAYIGGGQAGDDSPTAKYFTYKNYEEAYLITGVKEEYKSLETFDLPEACDHYFVVGIDANAFNGCNVTKLILPKNYLVLKDGAFENCESLKSVYIQSDNPKGFSISYSGGLVRGVANGFKFYVPKGSLSAYESDYNWRNYKNYLQEYEQI